MRNHIVTIVILALFLLGCSVDAPNHVNVPPTPLPYVTPLYTPSPSKTPDLLPTPTEYRLDYEVIYRNEDFVIRQARIGSKESMRQYDIPIPKSRIENSHYEFQMEWVEYSSPIEDGFRFGKIVTIPTTNDSSNLSFV